MPFNARAACAEPITIAGRRGFGMIDSATSRKLGELKLHEIVDIMERQERMSETFGLPFDDRFRQIVDELYLMKQENRIKGLVKRARFRWPNADSSSVLFLPERELERSTIRNLSHCSFTQASLCNTGLRKQRTLEGLLVLIKLGDGYYLPEVLGLVDCAFL